MKQEIRRCLLVVMAGVFAFSILYQVDNKYTAALPGGPGYNVLPADADQAFPLVDGWEYYPGQLLSPAEFQQDVPEPQSIYVGQYPNFSAHLGSPYGQATYRLVLENEGLPSALVLYLPELLCAGRVYINGQLAGEQGSLSPYLPQVVDGLYAFWAGEQTEIVIQCANYTHYYSGMYYPPIVGTPTAIHQMLTGKMIVYGALCFLSLAAALSNLALWLWGRDRLARWMGILCLAFSLRMCYPFLRTLGFPSVRPLYGLEDFCGNVVLLCAMLMAGHLSADMTPLRYRKASVALAAFLCAASVIFPLFILPYAPFFINIYGSLLFIGKILAGISLFYLAIRGLRTKRPLARHLLSAACFYSLSLAISLLTVNRFEPICGAWPEEYGGFALVAGFAILMVHRGFLLMAENRRLNLHLQREVARKTQALETLLAERRELLATLIHDVKNPLTAVRSYADLVRGGGIAVDEETAGYLDALAERIEAVEDRFHLLQGFSRGERGMFSAQPLCLNDFLSQFYETNRPDLELCGLTFHLSLPHEPLVIAGDQDRLQVALENLCYNALSFTPEDGQITLSLHQEAEWAVVSVADTGAGIPPEDLPHVFDRGFTRRPDGSGDGLGLFIVHTVALEHGGSAKVASPPGEGATFSLYLPVLSPPSPGYDPPFA